MVTADPTQFKNGRHMSYMTTIEWFFTEFWKVMFYRSMAFTLVITLTACASATSFRGFKPPPEDFEMWSKKGYEPHDVRQSMLECGYTYGFGEPPRTKRSTNDIASSQNCMISKGYKYTGRFGTICNPTSTTYYDGEGKIHAYPERNLPACQ